MLVVPFLSPRRKPPRNIFDPPTLLELVLSSPLKHLIRFTHTLLTSLRAPTPSLTPAIRVVCISDTHTKTYAIPDGDILIHAGDLTDAGTIAELQAQIDWLASLPHQHKIAIAGNHDTYLDPRSRETLSKADREGHLHWKGIHYLQHSSITLSFSSSSHPTRTLKLYGAPQLPACGGGSFAFQYPRGLDAWTDTVPVDTDILITHTPPKYHRDLPVALGCEWLLKESWRVRPKLHIFGHIHAGAGIENVWWDEGQAGYERGFARKRKGIVWDIVDIWGWVELLRVVVYGIMGVIWSRVWGGEQMSGWFVNAALMHNNTEELRNQVQVVEI